ncbi:MAG: MaoC family dehydratase N-terminal domain-containing protein [Chakrabartia sp.]
MGAWDAWIGRNETREDLVTPGLIARFGATLDRPAKDVAAVPQGLHWCLCLPDAPTAALGEDGHPRRENSPASFLPPVPLPRRMWASSSVQFHAPLLPNAPVRRVSTIAAISEKSGSTGALVFVDVDHQTEIAGTVAIEERQTIVYREATTTPPAPRPADQAPDLALWHWHRALMPSEALLFRYSALTFNSHRIHYDLPYAVNEERYRGLVVQGPLMATLLLDLAARELGDNRLSRFAFRGQSPAISGEPLFLVGRQEGSQISLAALGGDGRMVMSAEASL